MRKGLWLAASLLVIAVLLLGGCAQPPPNPWPAPVSEILPAELPTDFPENLRWLTEEEKSRIIEIALNTPAALEWRQKESQYETRIGWIALTPSSDGEGYSGYRKFEYEIVATGIPRGTVDITPEDSPERIVSIGVPEEAEIYPDVTIGFGEPVEWIVSVAIDMETEKVVFDEAYPARGIVIPEEPGRPTKAPPPRLP